MKAILTIEKDEEEYETYFEFSIQPAEPDVGIPQPYIEEWYIIQIKDGKENLHESNWPFDNDHVRKTVENIEELLMDDHYQECKGRYDEAVENGYRGKFHY